MVAPRLYVRTLSVSLPGPLTNGDAALDVCAAYVGGAGPTRAANYTVFAVAGFSPPLAPPGWPVPGAGFPTLFSGTVDLPVDPSTPYDAEESGYGWPLVATPIPPNPPFEIPNDAGTTPPGLYCAMFSDDVGGANADHTDYAYFLVRRRVETTKVLVVFPFSTLAVYSGGAPNAHNNPYNSFSPSRARRVSMERPFKNQAYGSKEDVCVQFPHKMLRFFRDTDWAAVQTALRTALGDSEYTFDVGDVDVCTSFDLHSDPNVLDGITLVVSVGHDEYLSKEMRDKLEAFVAGGGNIMFLSANTAWWQIRIDETNRIIWSYKSSLEDPYALDQYERVTTNFCAVPAAGIYGGGFAGREENTLTGVSYRRGVLGGSGKGVTGYSVAMPGHPYMARTGLAQGAILGSDLLFALETDAADYVLDGGVPVATGADNSPLNFEIIAWADLTNTSAGQRGHATMGRYTNVGTVFTAASTHWVPLIATDANVRIVTENVVADLVQTHTRADVTLSAREYPPETFVELDSGLSGVTPAFTGIVQGQLLLLRDGQNRVMDPENPSAGEGAAPSINVLSGTTCYGSDLWGSFVYAGTTSGAIHRHTGKIFQSGQSWTSWVNVGERVLAIAGSDLNPFVVSRPTVGGVNTLHHIESGPVAVRMGRLYPPVRGITSLDGVLYAIHDDADDGTSELALYARLAASADLTWMRIGTVPAGTYALAVYYGRLYALAGGEGSTAPSLHWCSAVPDAAYPYAPTRLLFLDDADYAIGSLTYDGTFTTTTSGTLSFAYTKVCRANAGLVFFYDGATGNADLGAFDAAGAYTSLNQWTPGFNTWDLIVPIRCTYNKDWNDPAQLDVVEKVLFYRKSSGASSIGYFDGSYVYQEDSAPAFTAGWSHIVCTHAGELLFYNSSTGAYAIGKLDDSGGWHQTGTSGTIGTGWEQVAVAGHTWVVFYKNDGATELRELHGGVLGSATFAPSADSAWAGRLVVATAMGSQLFYDSAGAVATVVAWATRSPIAAARLVLRAYPRGFSAGWQQIIAVAAS